MIRIEPPVTPDADEARRWAEEELARSEYSRGGSSTWLGDLIDWFLRMLDGLGQGVGGTLGALGAIVIALLVIALVAVVVWLVVGPLRRSRAAAEDDALFADSRTASQLADVAAAAAAAGDWGTATAELYRAVIRRLAERELLALTPGLTAHEAAIDAGRVLPALAGDLRLDADAFDRIRYGDGSATAADHAHVSATFAAVRAARRTVEPGQTAEATP